MSPAKKSTPVTSPVKKTRAKKPVSKEAGASKTRRNPGGTRAVSPEKNGGRFTKTVYQTLYAAGRLISRTRHLKEIGKIVKWKRLSSGAKEVFDSTQQGVSHLSGSIKSAVEVEKISKGAQMAWDSTKQGVHKVGGSLKNAVKVEKISAGAQKAWDATKQGVHQVSGSLKKAVKAEKISSGAQKVWSSTKQGVGKIRRGTTEGLAEIGESFKAGYQSFETAEKFRVAPAPAPVATKKVLTPPPAKKLVYSSKKNAPPKVSDASNPVMDDDLEKEVDQIVNEIAQI